jgi:UPF0755 protein
LGTPFSEIGVRLKEAGIIEDPRIFEIVARVKGVAHQLRAGKYAFPERASYHDVVKILAEGRAEFVRVTIPEGLTIRQIAALLSEKIGLDSARFVQQANDTSFIRKLGLPDPSLEGYLFPETYNFHFTTTEEQALRALVQQFHNHITDSIRARVEESGLSLREVVTLASIIEGEAILDSERTIISAVYHNRLRRGMLLQADPTIQYIIPDRPRRLLKRDLEIDSPYNTYLYPGLPPGPINNPGWKSIEAALYPDTVDFLYFVARGDGSHAFSRTMSQHLKAKGDFDKIRRRVARDKREKGAQ